jgi:MarR family transcriptional regulator, organic hydroperoxide resistance regulator
MNVNENLQMQIFAWSVETDWLLSACKSCRKAGGKPLYRLTDSLPYLLNRVGVRMGDFFSRRIAGFGVTLPMYRVMAALWEKGDQRLGDLADMTSIEISTLSRLVGTMKRKGLVSRKRLEDNARTVAINLTAKGKALVEELIPIAMQFEDIAVRNFPKHGLSDLKSTLSQIHDSLGSLEPEIAKAEAERKVRKR